MTASGEEAVLQIAGHEVRVGHPDRVLFAERGETKLDLVEYNLGIAEPL